MVEYVDLGTNVETLVNALYSDEVAQLVSRKDENITQYYKESPTGQLWIKKMHIIRKGVCVAGYSSEAVSAVRKVIGEIAGDTINTESFHIKSDKDLNGGDELNITKVILVAVHCAGKRVIDDEDDSGQLDVLYDKVCDIGAEIMLIYMELPRSLYGHMKNVIYHPKIADIVFPEEPILQYLANDNRFITVCEGKSLSTMQRNVIEEWLATPVDASHPVYETASRKINEMEKTKAFMESYQIENSYQAVNPNAFEIMEADKNDRGGLRSMATQFKATLQGYQNLGESNSGSNRIETDFYDDTPVDQIASQSSKV